MSLLTIYIYTSIGSFLLLRGIDFVFVKARNAVYKTLAIEIPRGISFKSLLFDIVTSFIPIVNVLYILATYWITNGMVRVADIFIEESKTSSIEQMREKYGNMKVR